MTAARFASRWRFVPAAIWAAAIWAESSTTWPGVAGSTHWLPLPGWLPPDKLAHTVLFGVQALLIAAPIAQPRRRDLGAAWALATAWGAIDELHQLWVPGRSSDPWDWLADAIGAAAGIALLQIYLKLRTNRNNA